MRQRCQKNESKKRWALPTTKIGSKSLRIAALAEANRPRPSPSATKTCRAGRSHSLKSSCLIISAIPRRYNPLTMAGWPGRTAPLERTGYKKRRQFSRAHSRIPMWTPWCDDRQAKAFWTGKAPPLFRYLAPGCSAAKSG